MPIGYLVAVAFVTVGTLFALAPVRRPRPLANLSYRLGLVINEVPFLALYWLLFWTLFTLSQGDLATPSGRAVVGLAILTVAGLVVIAWRVLLARAATERALVGGLGPNWRAAIKTEMEVPRRRLPLARILITPFLMRRRDVIRIANIRYGDAGRRNLLDLYHHRSRPSGAPVLIHLHGGNYDGGRKSSQSLPLLYRLASQGWVCVSANYRLRPEAQHPDHLIDLKRVIDWVRQHGLEYGADTTTLFVSGSSAGAHMSALAALTPGDPAFQPGFEDADTSVTAAICLNDYYGTYYNQGALSSPLTFFGPNAPPFFIAHGDQDSVVPVENAERFACTLRGVSANPVVYARLPGAHHAFDLFHSLRFETVVDAIESFAAWVRSREEPGKRVESEHLLTSRCSPH